MKLTAALPFFGSLKSSTQKSPAATARTPGKFAKLSVARQLQILLVMLVVCLSAGAALIWLHNQDAARTATYVGTATEMQMLSQRIANSAQQAARGVPAAFDQLRQGREAYAANLQLLAEGGEKNGVRVPASPAELQPLIKELATRWTTTDRSIQLILAQRQGLIDLSRRESEIQRTVPRLSLLAQELVVTAIDEKESANAITFARQLLTDIGNFDFVNALRLLSTETPNPQVALNLVSNTRQYGNTLAGLTGSGKSAMVSALRSESALEKARTLEKVFTPFAEHVQAITANMARLAAAKQGSREVFTESEKLLKDPASLSASYQTQTYQQTAYAFAAALFGIMALACLYMLARVFLDDARKRAALSEQENRRNQDAILNLLDEMSRVAEGDLTVQAKVTEDVTGAIADSINYTIEQLRQLVVGVTKASNQVTHATGDTQKVATQLLKASQKQTAEIQSTSRSVVQIAETMQKVSDSASQSAQVAQSSLTVAEKGSIAVQNAIRSMNDIREQIQETAKRIKRLGESSQEIGEIVQLITDITEQTNVLALNAAIQAASAGEAGRGFAVVAEEVQRLAERSAEATKHISSIVHSIQQDTQSTVEAMERSTQGVVEGTRVADEAGQALHEIEDVSKKLAELIGSISTSTGEQAKTAEQVAANMKNILSITQLTSSGTQQTARSTNELIAMAVELKHSVSGFKLA